MKNLAERLVWARTKKGLSQEQLAKDVGVAQSTIGNLEAGIRLTARKITAIAKELGVDATWLAEGTGSKYPSHLPIVKSLTDPEGSNNHYSAQEPQSTYDLVSADDTDMEVGKIEYWSARGSCGGGFQNYDELPKGHLVKEIAFFRKYNLRPGNAFAIYADGSSMADFIVDGDIVIFDKSKTEPRSGKIFAIDHPDGLRIKKLRREMDGSWILESTNADKRAYPDEKITPEHETLLKIHGEFVYRQGG